MHGRSYPCLRRFLYEVAATATSRLNNETHHADYDQCLSTCSVNMKSMHQSISPVVHVGTHRKERQVRNSCNACSSQKIRCSKERPQCHRCVDKGLECEYSMSRRTGERARVADSPPRQSQGSTNGEKAQSTIAAVVPARPRSFSDNAIEHSLEDISDPFSVSEQDHIGWMLSVSPENITLPVEMDLTADLTPAMERGNDLDVVSAGPQEYKSPTYDYNFDYIVDQTREPQASGHPKSQQSDPAVPKSDFGSLSDTGLRSLPPKKADDCLTEAIHILTDLHVPARGCITSTNDATYSMQLQDPLDDTPREVGMVLSQNGKALRKLGNLLDCRCSLRQDVAVLVCIGLHKAIGWYAEILGDDNGPQDHPAKQSLLFGRIAKAPSFMGSYRLDSKAQKLLSAHLVLTQLEEHIEPFMRKLSNLQSASSSVSSPRSTPTSSTDIESTLLEQHRQTLQDEIDRVIARANSIKQK